MPSPQPGVLGCHPVGSWIDDLDVCLVVAANAVALAQVTDAAPLALGGATPDPYALDAGQRKLQAVVDYWACAAYRFGRLGVFAPCREEHVEFRAIASSASAASRIREQCRYQYDTRVDRRHEATASSGRPSFLRSASPTASRPSVTNRSAVAASTS